MQMKTLKLYNAVLTFVIFLLLSLPVNAQYSNGFEWDRYTDYSGIDNPHNDQAGNNVWSYEHFTNQDFLNSTALTSTVYDPPRWGDDQHNFSAGDQNVNFWQGYQIYNMGPGFPHPYYSTLIRWTNPVGDNVDIDFTGNLKMWWAGWNPGTESYISYPMDVRFVIGLYDESENQYISLRDEIIDAPFETFRDTGTTNWGDNPNITIPVDYHVNMDLGDSYFWSIMPLETVNKGAWITLNDNPMRITYDAPVVPEPVSSVLFITGGAVLGFLRLRK